MKEPEKGMLEGAKNGIREVCKDNKGCSNGVFTMAKTKWQREVGLEFMKVHEKIQELKTDMKWCKWLCMSVLVAIAINIVKGLL